MLDGRDSAAGWGVGPLAAVDPLHRSYGAADVERGLEELERTLQRRRLRGGPPETGVAALLSYELLDPRGAVRPSLPALVLVEVDSSLRWLEDGRLRSTTCRSESEGLKQIVGRIERAAAVAEPIVARGRPTTSLPREAYLRAVCRVKEHIGRGDIYQANLCQRFEVACTGDALASYARMVLATPAPRSAYLETPEFALASISPETFLLGDVEGRVETRPIKGTRARGATAEADRLAAEALLHSEKDRAELLMIVDLERNDLSRVCRAGSVVVPELLALQTYPAVHHLAARVQGRLNAGVDVRSLLCATFPGGSITGAPKIRAMEILRELEPVDRGYFTGSLFWFGDDGTLDSSILIRSWIFAGQHGYLGAGGGIVADSEPEAEWHESNHKARALTQALGFDPEEAV